MTREFGETKRPPNLWHKEVRSYWSDLIPAVFIAGGLATTLLAVFMAGLDLPWSAAVQQQPALLILGLVPHLLLIAILLRRYSPLQVRASVWSWLAIIPVALALGIMNLVLSAWAGIGSGTTEAILPASAFGFPVGLFLTFALVVAWLVVPVAEELLFREWLPRKLPFFAAMIPNAFVFGLFHISVEAEPVAMFGRFAFAFIAGCFLFQARRRTGNIYVAILMHAAINVATSVRLDF